MNTQLETAAPTDSAPNNEGREAAFRAEIHVPEAEYNANVPVDLIEPDPNNRDKIDKARVTALAATIATEGLLQPIVLRLLANGKYRIMAGEHRWRAHLELKRATIASRIYKNETDLTAAKKKAVENALRVELTPLERAKRFRELAELGAGQKEIGALFGGVSQPVVANALRLLELPAEVQAMVSDGRLSEAHGVSLARFARWPRVCACIARNCIEREATAKSLNRDKLPYTYELKRAKLVVEINTGSHWSGETLYELPAEVKNDPDFIELHQSTYYLLPDATKGVAVNKWKKMKADLDKAMAEKEAEKKKAEAKRVAKGGAPTAEQVERKKKIAANKAARGAVEIALAGAVQRVKGAKGIDALSIYLLASECSVRMDVEAAARLLSITLPPKFQDYRHEDWAKLPPVDALKLAAVGLAMDKAKDAIRHASKVPEEITFLGSDGKPPAKPVADVTGQQGELVGIKPAAVAKAPKAAPAKAGKKGGRK